MERPTKGEWFRGRWAVAGCFLGNMLGVHSLPLYGQSVFISPLQHSFGWSRLQLSLGTTIVILALAISAPLAGALADRVRINWLVSFSASCMALGFFFLSRMTADISSFYLPLTFLAFFGGACSTLTYSRVISAHFVAARGTALGLTATGNGVANILTPLVLAPIIVGHGWRSAYLLLATITVLAVPILMALVRMPVNVEARTGNDEPVLSGMTLRQALRDRAGWILAIVFFLIPLGAGGIITHIVPMLTDTGLSPEQAATRASGIGLAVVLSRLITGFLLDRYFAPRVGATLLLIAAGAMLLLALGGPSFAFSGALGTGLAIGAEIDLVGYLTARYFGLRAFGRIFGVYYSVLLIGTALSPISYAWIYQSFSSYTPALFAASATLVMAAVLLLLLRRFPTKTSHTA